jgi:hypothetical protein
MRTTNVYEIFFDDCDYPLIVNDHSFNQEFIDVVAKYEKKCSNKFTYTKYTISENNYSAFSYILDLKNQIINDSPATAEYCVYDGYRRSIGDIVQAMTLCSKTGTYKDLKNT